MFSFRVFSWLAFTRFHFPGVGSRAGASPAGPVVALEARAADTVAPAALVCDVVALGSIVDPAVSWVAVIR